MLVWRKLLKATSGRENLGNFYMAPQLGWNIITPLEKKHKQQSKPMRS